MSREIENQPLLAEADRGAGRVESTVARFCAEDLGHEPHTWSAPAGVDIHGRVIVQPADYRCSGYPAPGGPGWDTLTGTEKRSAAAAAVVDAARDRMYRAGGTEDA